MDSLEWYKYYRTNEYGTKSDDMKLAAVDHMIKTIIEEIKTGSVAIENSPFIMEIKNIFERKAELNYVNWSRQAVDLMDAALIISAVWEVLQDSEYNVRLRRPDCRSWVFGLNHRIMDQQQKNLEGILQKTFTNFKNWAREQNKPKPQPEPIPATTPPAATAAAAAAYKGGVGAPPDANGAAPGSVTNTGGNTASPPTASAAPNAPQSGAVSPGVVAPHRAATVAASPPAAAAPHRSTPQNRSAAPTPHRSASAAASAASAPHRHMPPHRPGENAPVEDEFANNADFPVGGNTAPNGAPATAAAPHRHVPANRTGAAAAGATAPHRPAGRTGAPGSNTAQRPGTRTQTPPAAARRPASPNRPGVTNTPPSRGNQPPQAADKAPRTGAPAPSGQDAVTRLVNMQTELDDILRQLKGGKDNQLRQVAMGQIELYNRIARVYDQHLSLAENSNNPDYLDAVNAQKEYMDFIVERLSGMGVEKISSRPGTPFDDRYHETAISGGSLPRGATIKRSISPGFKNGDSVWLREKVEI